MKRRTLFLAALILVVSVINLGFARPARASLDDFSFKSFEADYYLSRDAKNVAQLKVVEKLTPIFPQIDQNHGLRRAIPETYGGKPLHLAIGSVADANGTERSYTLSHENGNTVVTSKAPDFVHGEQTYVITYTVDNVATFFGDHDELYWDTNGDQWSQVFGSVAARVHVPASLAASLQSRQACYTGGYGSSASDCSIVRNTLAGDTIVAAQANRSLQPNETMSFVLGFDKGTFAAYRQPLRDALLFWGFLFVPPVLALMFGLLIWRKYGRDARGRGVVVAQYEPEEGIGPILASVILEEGMRTNAISATILDLCIRGYMKLYEIDKKKLLGKKVDYELELTREDTTGLTAEEVKLLGLLFGQIVIGRRAPMEELKNKLYKGAQEIGKSAATLATRQGYFVRNPQAVQVKYSTFAMVPLVIAGILLRVHFGGFMPVGVLVAGLILLGIARIMPARTSKGALSKEHLEGLKLYMEMAEKDRIAMLQSPEGAEKSRVDPTDKRQLLKLYERLLPYAVLFGMEKEWAKEFAGLYAQSPDWYVGPGNFNAIGFSHAMSGFNGASAASFTAPSSSGSSGFGGGGFSGGGGGGGGGGGA